MPPHSSLMFIYACLHFPHAFPFHKTVVELQATLIPCHRYIYYTFMEFNRFNVRLIDTLNIQTALHMHPDVLLHIHTALHFTHTLRFTLSTSLLYIWHNHTDLGFPHTSRLKLSTSFFYTLHFHTFHVTQLHFHTFTQLYNSLICPDLHFPHHFSTFQTFSQVSILPRH